MKTIKILYVVLICLLSFSCENEDKGEIDTFDYEYLTPVANYKNLIESAQCTNIPRPSDTYLYPIVPGTDAWAESHEKGIGEVIKACRVPEHILREQSTPAVIQTFFDYPFTMDIYFSSSTLLNGFKKSVGYNSAYAELLKRRDAGKCLLERYLLYNPVGCDMAIVMAPLFELLLAQPEFYSQLNSKEKQVCVKEALRKIEIRIAFNPALAHQRETACFLIGRVMVNAKYSPFVKEVKNNEGLSQYLENQTVGYEGYDIILSYATQFIK